MNTNTANTNTVTAPMSFADFLNAVNAAAVPDNTIMGTASNGRPVMIAECSHEDISSSPTEQMLDNMEAITAAAKASRAQYEEQIKEQVAAIVADLRKVAGLNIEILGSWIWVTGNTKPNRETLKRLGFFWSKNKEAWYKKPAEPEGKKKYHRGFYKDMESLREHWEADMIPFN